MVQNTLLKAGADKLLVAANNASPFVKFLSEYFAKPKYVTPFVVNAVTFNFDNQDREGVGLFRGDLIEWLWNNRGRKVIAVTE